MQDQLHSSRATDLIGEICSPNLCFLMVAPDALSGAIAKRTGFSGVPASMGTIACSLDYLDTNDHLLEASGLVDESNHVVAAAT